MIVFEPRLRGKPLIEGGAARRIEERVRNQLCFCSCSVVVQAFLSVLSGFGALGLLRTQWLPHLVPLDATRVFL
jgi:hypothetical protein